jgi:anionic cell wall polymer biosynthesis LytR-Cps2A-Psr (LCP) family protein
MDGALALKYSRSRETTSDFDRAKRQQIVLVALKEKLLSLNTLLNPKKISDILVFWAIMSKLI